MEKVIHGDLEAQEFEVIERSGRYFVRYNAGAHQTAWREDEISLADLELIQSGPEGESRALFGLQKRLLASGVDPYRSNWSSKPAEA